MYILELEKDSVSSKIIASIFRDIGYKKVNKLLDKYGLKTFDLLKRRRENKFSQHFINILKARLDLPDSGSIYFSEESKTDLILILSQRQLIHLLAGFMSCTFRSGKNNDSSWGIFWVILTQGYSDKISSVEIEACKIYMELEY